MWLRVCPPMLREIAAGQNLAVRLHRDREDEYVRVRVERVSVPVMAFSRAMWLRGLSADAS